MKLGKKDLGYIINIDSGKEELYLPQVEEYTPEQSYILFSAFFKLSAIFLEFYNKFVESDEQEGG